jgi:Ni/Co efflux regulator RcnB
MRTTAWVAALIALSMTIGTSGFAQGNREKDRDREGSSRQDLRLHRGQKERRETPQRQPDRRDEYGAGPNQQFHRGERLPMEYRQRIFVVDDWRNHRLSSPPRGYHWVQMGGDYVLIAITTGIILDLLINH